MPPSAPPSAAPPATSAPTTDPPPQDPTAAAYDLALQGANADQITAYLAQAHPTATPAAVMTELQARFQALANQSPDAVIGYCIAKLLDLTRQANEIGDLDAARQCTKHLLDFAAKRQATPPRRDTVDGDYQ